MSPFSSLKRQIRTASKRARLGLAIGGFDVSFNEHKDQAFAPHWQPHAWVLVPTSQIKKRKREFKSRFRSRNTALSKPVMIKSWDENNACPAYALKGEFDRRITLPPTKLRSGEKKRQNNRHKPLRSHQKMELVRMLDRIGLEGRLCLIKTQIIEEDGLMKIKKTPKSKESRV